MSRLASIKITVMELNGYFHCRKCSLLSGSLWKMFFPWALADLSESLHNGNASSISFHLARQPTSQRVHGCLLTAGFSLPLLWMLHLQGGKGHFIPRSFSFTFLKMEQFFLFFCQWATVRWWSIFWSSGEWNVYWHFKQFFLAFRYISTSLCPAQLFHIFVFATFFSVCELNYSWDWARKFWRKLTCKLLGKDLKRWETQRAREDIRWWWTLGKILKTFATGLRVLTLKSKISQCCVLLNMLLVKLCISGKERDHGLNREDFKWTPRGHIMV